MAVLMPFAHGPKLAAPSAGGRTSRIVPALTVLALLLAASPSAGTPAPARIGDLVQHAGDVSQRLVGYGLVVGLDGTGDRSFGGLSSQNATVHSVVNLLRRFHVEVPPEHLRLRNVAAVLVTAEVSPYLRSGGRFEVSVSALGDAISLEGGVLWIAPLSTDPDLPPLATAQGAVMVTRPDDKKRGPWIRPSNSGRIPDGGIMEVDPAPVVAEPVLHLRQPDRMTAVRIATAINTALGEGTAKVEDPGAVRLNVTGEDAAQTLAAIDALTVTPDAPARVVIHTREGLVAAGGDIRVGAAVIHHQGITLEIGSTEPTAGGPRGLISVPADARVEDVAAGLHAAGADPEEIAAIFEALRDAGALQAEVIVR